MNFIKKNYFKLGVFLITGAPLLTVISCTQKTDENIDEKIVVEIIKKFGYKQQTTKNNFFPNKWTKTTKLTVKDLGIEEPKNNGVTISYFFVAADLNAGSIVVRIELLRQKIVKEHLILISGYKTQDQQDQDDVDATELAFAK